MLSLAIAIAISASIVRTASTLTESRFKPTYFTRRRKMPFDRLLKYLLSMHKTSTQSALHNFFESRGIFMYLANMAAIAKNEANIQIKAERADKDNKYEYQANVNTLIGSLRDKLADPFAHWYFSGIKYRPCCWFEDFPQIHLYR